jgi:hypothetical protein
MGEVFSRVLMEIDRDVDLCRGVVWFVKPWLNKTLLVSVKEQMAGICFEGEPRSISSSIEPEP